MFILDSMLIGGIRFVLDKVAAAAEQELNDDSTLRQHLLEAQMRLELGEISEDEFADTERDILERMREIKKRQQGESVEPGNYTIAGVEANFDSEE